MGKKPDHLLIFDDDADRRVGLVEQLQQQGYTVAIAESGKQALQMMDLQVFDLVLLNAEAPTMSGMAVFEQMKADNGLQHIPVVILAPADQLSVLERALEMGANDYLPLPYTPALLKVRIESQLRRLPDYEDDYLQNVMQKTKYERDLEIGRQIQSDFLPSALPAPEGWDIAAHFGPARAVAGDFYDSFMLAQNRRVAAVVADVCDKGVGAALFMALIRSLIRSYVQLNLSLNWMDSLDGSIFSDRNASETNIRKAPPSTGASSLRNAVMLTNNYLINTHSKSNMFATAFFGVLDQASGSFSYVNGGHCPPVFFGSEGIKARLTPTGPAIGILPDVDYKMGHIQFEPGDTLLIYTDGVTDARNLNGEMFTEKRLLLILQEPVASARTLLDRIVFSLRDFMSTADQFDDITMMAIRRLPKDEN